MMNPPEIYVKSDATTDLSSKMTTASDLSSAAHFADFPSKDVYFKTWEQYMKWKGDTDVDENDDSENTVLTFFHYLHDTLKYAPSTLWTKSGHLKKVLLAMRKIDLKDYSTVQLQLKQWSKRHVKKKSKIFQVEEVFRYLRTAPVEPVHTEARAALAFGYFGTLRCDDLHKLKWEFVSVERDELVVRLDFDRKTGANVSHFRVPRSHDNPAQCAVGAILYYRLKSRTKHSPENKNGKVFKTIRKGKFTDIPKGVNKIREIPQFIAKFLGLPNPERYTGQCFRRTSATALADSGASRLQLKRAGCWLSDSVVEGYINDSKRLRSDIAQNLLIKSDSSDKENQASNGNQVIKRSAPPSFNQQNNQGPLVSNCNNCIIQIGYDSKREPLFYRTPRRGRGWPKLKANIEVLHSRSQ